MENTYIIGGMGNAAANVIESSLGDVRKDSQFVYLWTGKPTAGQSRVLDWLIDYGAKFIVYSETPRLPQAVADSAVSVEVVENMVEQAIADFEGATMLVLFDTTEDGEPTAMTERLIFKAHDVGMKVLELTNGLIPITVEDDAEPQPSEAVEAPRKPQDALKNWLGSPTANNYSRTSKEPVTPIATYKMTVYSDGTVRVEPALRAWGER